MHPYIWIAVGLPACGKSTWIDKNVNVRTSQDIVILGSDRILDEIAKEQGKTYNEVFKDNIDVAQDAFFWDLDEALQNGLNVFVDRTNLSIKSRRRLLSKVPADYKKIAVVFTCDKEVHDVRLQMRPGKTIPKGVMKSMEESFIYPTVEEGFDDVQEIVTG